MGCDLLVSGLFKGLVVDLLDVLFGFLVVGGFMFCCFDKGYVVV